MPLFINTNIGSEHVLTHLRRHTAAESLGEAVVVAWEAMRRHQLVLLSPHHRTEGVGQQVLDNVRVEAHLRLQELLVAVSCTWRKRYKAL
jgi:hypothetical protein